MAKTELEDDGVIDTPVAQDEPEITNNRDEINNDVRAALMQLKGETVEKAETPDEIGEPPETEKPEKAAKPRDEEGKFAKAAKPDKESTAAPEPAAVETKSPPAETAKASTEPSTAAVAPPVSWAADAKAGWSAVPPAIQNAVLKREAEVSAGFRQKSEESRQYEAVLSPIAEAAKRNGIQVDEGVKRLVAANDFLERDAPSAIMWLAKSYGVDLTALVSNPPAPQPQRFVDPMVPQLNQKLSSLEGQLNGFLQKQTLGVVESFAQSPEHPHYSAVENQLLKIIPLVQQENPGFSQAEVLQEAYEQAIWLNRDVRSAMLAEQTAAAEKANSDKLADTERTRIAAVTAKAGKSAKAAVSIKGSSTGAAATPKAVVNGSGDVYDDVRSAMRQLREERA